MSIGLHQKDNLKYCISKTSTQSFGLFLLIILSGNIQQNPGPIRYPCAICSKPEVKNHQGLQCDECDTWVHAKCDGLTKEDYKKYQNIHSLVFQCPQCRLLTFTDSFFMNESSTVSTSNSFETVSDSEEFQTKFQNSYRKDRKLGEGGVFIAVDNNYITTEILTGSDCETAWCKINTQGRQHLYIGTFYRQSCSAIEKLEELEKSINCIMNTSQTLPNVILGGDFNLPHINWQTNTVNTNPQYGKALNEKLIEISNNNDMNQMVIEPTRGQNTIDLLMTTNPGLVSNIEVHPGMSDHQVVIVNVDMKAKHQKRNPDWCTYLKGTI